MSDKDRPHSERYFTDARDYWWHDDYLALLARRLGLASAPAVLEVGTGQGHFARAWLPHLGRSFAFTGVDREPKSLAIARERTEAFLRLRQLDGSCSFVEASADRLPFDDGTFDFVFCQTLLIHLHDPRPAFAEMVRVCKPGGWILASEPNNYGGFQRVALGGPQDDIEWQLRIIELQMRCTRGKAALGLGWNNFGAHLPTLFEGLEDLRYYQNDRPWVMSPPYARPQEAAALADLRTAVTEGAWGWDRDTARRYFLAGGGSEARFEALYDEALSTMAAELAQLDAGRWVELTGFSGLIAAGRKPG